MRFCGIPLGVNYLQRACNNFSMKPENTCALRQQEKEEQRRSFAYGNTKIENPNVTREMVDKAADELGAPKHERRTGTA